jgi:hypothetical protein
MELSDSPSARDNLIALPKWAVAAALSLLSAGAVAGALLLVIPGLTPAVRDAGGRLLFVSLPVLALGIVGVGASRARTERIDAMVGRFLRHTVARKFRAYLVRPNNDAEASGPYAGLFEQMTCTSRAGADSYCYYEFTDVQGRVFGVTVKSNVYNFEFDAVLEFVNAPAGYQSPTSEETLHVASLADWPSAATHPLVAVASAAIYGSLAEGYAILIDARSDEASIRVSYRFRQKMQTNFLLSPYLRRYFAEDAAIALYFFYKEVLEKSSGSIRGGAGAAA